MEHNTVKTGCCGLTCHWWWAPWWRNIGVAGPCHRSHCGTGPSDVSWPEWQVPGSVEQVCCRSHYSRASGSAVGSAGWRWCYLLRRARHWNTQTSSPHIPPQTPETLCNTYGLNKSSPNSKPVLVLIELSTANITDYVVLPMWGSIALLPV